MTLAGVSSMLAVILAGVLLSAAGLKIRRPSDTAADFAGLGLPAARVLSFAVPATEAAIALALVLVPGWGAVAAVVLLAAFTTLLAGVVRSGRVVTCRCFGAASQDPVDARSLVRNAVLIAMALPVVSLDRLTTPTVVDVVTVVAAIGAGALVTRRGMHARMAP